MSLIPVGLTIICINCKTVHNEGISKGILLPCIGRSRYLTKMSRAATEPITDLVEIDELAN